MEKTRIKVEASVHAPMAKVWSCWINPDDIICWNAASADWHTVSAINDLRPGGEFSFRMEAKDRSAGFDFKGKYLSVEPLKSFSYQTEDDRLVEVRFQAVGAEVRIEETFEAEKLNPIELQRQGWQAILDNFKLYVETKL